MEGGGRSIASCVGRDADYRYPNSGLQQRRRGSAPIGRRDSRLAEPASGWNGALGRFDSTECLTTGSTDSRKSAPVVFSEEHSNESTARFRWMDSAIRNAGINTSFLKAGRQEETRNIMKLSTTTDLKDQVAIVTGASQGLGKAVAIALANQRCQGRVPGSKRRQAGRDGQRNRSGRWNGRGGLRATSPIEPPRQLRLKVPRRSMADSTSWSTMPASLATS